MMRAEAAADALRTLERMGIQAVQLRRLVDDEHLPESDRQYLGRCFDLLEMELSALTRYIEALR